ncbi:MAG TPA: hypothetical protein VE978_21645 [Chitinophagales bacterium]|nr:hypothetical protein [Chitinophagales bacterium]
MEEKNSEEEKVNEPEVDYSISKKKRIRFFKSFEEAEEATIRDRMNMTPEERLATVTRMLEAMYAEKLSKPLKNQRITIIC